MALVASETTRDGVTVWKPSGIGLAMAILRKMRARKVAHRARCATGPAVFATLDDGRPRVLRRLVAFLQALQDDHRGLLDGSPGHVDDRPVGMPAEDPQRVL